MVEGTPLLREHLGKTWIEGSNPSVSAKPLGSMRLLGAFLFLSAILCAIVLGIEQFPSA